MSGTAAHQPVRQHCGFGYRPPRHLKPSRPATSRRRTCRFGHAAAIHPIIHHNDASGILDAERSRLFRLWKNGSLRVCDTQTSFDFPLPSPGFLFHFFYFIFHFSFLVSQPAYLLCMSCPLPRQPSEELQLPPAAAGEKERATSTGPDRSRALATVSCRPTQQPANQAAWVRYGGP